MKGKLVWSDGRVEKREEIAGQYYIIRKLLPIAATVEDFGRIYIYNGMVIDIYHPMHPKYDPKSIVDTRFKCSRVDSEGYVVYVQCEK